MFDIALALTGAPAPQPQRSAPSEEPREDEFARAMKSWERSSDRTHSKPPVRERPERRIERADDESERAPPFETRAVTKESTTPDRESDDARAASDAADERIETEAGNAPDETPPASDDKPAPHEARREPSADGQIAAANAEAGFETHFVAKGDASAVIAPAAPPAAGNAANSETEAKAKAAPTEPVRAPAAPPMAPAQLAGTATDGRAQRTPARAESAAAMPPAHASRSVLPEGEAANSKSEGTQAANGQTPQPRIAPAHAAARTTATLPLATETGAAPPALPPTEKPAAPKQQADTAAPELARIAPAIAAPAEALRSAKPAKDPAGHKPARTAAVADMGNAPAASVPKSADERVHATPTSPQPQAATETSAAPRPLLTHSFTSLTASASPLPTSTPEQAHEATVRVQMTGPRLAIPADAVAILIRRNAAAGAQQFDIKLDPAELGRIEVRLDMREDGVVKAHLLADRQDTLDLLMRDARALERALNGLGLKTERDGLSFSLRQDGAPQRERAEQSEHGFAYLEDDEGDPAPIPVRRHRDPSRLDIVI